MSDKEKKSFKWLDKLKQVKHIEIYVAVIFVAILLLIYLSNFNSTTKQKSVKQTSELTITSYVDNLEEDLSEILSNIGGISNVKVLITLDMQNVTVEDSKLTYTSFPEIKGIVITAKGVETTNSKMKILHAIEAVVNVNNKNIQILSSD